MTADQALTLLLAFNVLCGFINAGTAAAYLVEGRARGALAFTGLSAFCFYCAASY